VFDAVASGTLDRVDMIFTECHSVPGRTPAELVSRLQSAGYEVAAEFFVNQSFLVAPRPR
jgi:hypothetical protein